MFCENCGKELGNKFSFCTECGNSVKPIPSTATSTDDQAVALMNEKWWFRLLKVIYGVFHLPLLLVSFVILETNSHYDYTLQTRVEDSGAVFWYCILSFIIYLAVMRLIKVAVLYVVFGQKPEWRREIRSLF